jgi:hypothetical protein
LVSILTLLNFCTDLSVMSTTELFCATRLEGLHTPAVKEPRAFALFETETDSAAPRPTLFIRVRAEGEQEVLQLGSLSAECSVSRLLQELTLLFYPKKYQQLADFLYIVQERARGGMHTHAALLHCHAIAPLSLKYRLTIRDFL